MVKSRLEAFSDGVIAIIMVVLQKLAQVWLNSIYTY